MFKVLVVEDTEFFQTIFKKSLESKYQISIASSLKDSLEILKTQKFDLFIIDLILPDGHGFDLCAYLQSQKTEKAKPIIIVSGQSSLEEKLKGFEFGASDYLTKPFHPQELLARVNANAGKIPEPGIFPENGSEIHLGQLRIDRLKQKVFINDHEQINLTQIEFKLLVFFSTHLDHVLTRNQILSAVWPDSISISDRVVDTHISNLRKKLGPFSEHIKAVHGAGYRFNLPLAL